MNFVHVFCDTVCSCPRNVCSVHHEDGFMMCNCIIIGINKLKGHVYVCMYAHYSECLHSSVAKSHSPSERERRHWEATVQWYDRQGRKAAAELWWWVILPFLSWYRPTLRWSEVVRGWI